jgi:ABC-type dipeptide/oligopeptide/nickel transport system ATPase component
METVSPTPATVRQYEAEHRQGADQPRRSLAGQRGPVHGRPARRQHRGGGALGAPEGPDEVARIGVADLRGNLHGQVAYDFYGPRLASRDADVAESLRLVGLDPAFGPRRADALSVGEQQQVMLARALALRPSVLLLDEPTSALAETTKAAIEATLREARDPSACLLFSSSTTSARPSGSPTGFCARTRRAP